MNSRALLATLAALFGAAPALAALGGAAGVQIPYAGKLELNGALATGSFDFQFQIMVDGTTSTACDTKTVSAVAVTNGEFALTIPAVNEACVKGKDVHVIVSVRSAGGGAFTALGKQRVAPTLSAMTSGAGDFNAGALTATSVAASSVVASTLQSNGSLSAASANVTGAVSVGSLSAGSASFGNVSNTNDSTLTLNTSTFFPWVVKAETDGKVSFTTFNTRQVSFDGNSISTSIRARLSIVASTTPDIAETIKAAPNVEAADVVCADPENAEHVVRCGQNAHGVVGVVSDGTSSFLINSRSHSVDGPLTGQPLVLAGRVPVKVSRENGPIHIGDELALSSTPGVAMRATGPGPVVGVALADFDSQSPGSVLCFVKVSEGNVAALEKRVADLEAVVKHMAALNANPPEASR